MSKKKKQAIENESVTWYKLDNAANIYPAIITSSWSPNFRVSVTLKEKVRPELVQRALENCLPRFLNFSLILKKGLFWHYLEISDAKPTISREVRNPMTVIPKQENSGYHFRVCCFERRIALELLHVISDGSGAMVFLKALAAEYLRLCGAKIPYDAPGLINIKSKPDPEEMEDAFRKYARFKTRQTRKESRAYWVRGTHLPPGMVNLITGRIPVRDISGKAKEYGATITEFIASLIIWIMYKRQQTEHPRRELPIKVSVPINMRKFYDTKTMRNFSLFVNPGIEPRYGEYSFDEVVSDVHHFMRMNMKEKNLNAVMSANLGDELNYVVRALPLILKNKVLAAFYSAVGETRFSTDMSNLGIVEVPDEMKDYIETFDFMLGRPHSIGFAMGIVSFGDTLNITFSSSLKEVDCEREFFRELVRMGVHVKIESNR